MRSILLLFLLLGLSHTHWAYGPRASVEAYLERFHLVDAEREAQLLSDPALRDFYLCQIRSYQYICTQDARWLEGFETRWDDAVEGLEDKAEDNPLRGVMLAELYGKRAAIEFLQSNYFATVRMVRNCQKWIKKNEEAFPDNTEQLKYRGLFNIVFSAVPKKYQWITHTLGYVGDAELGLTQLDKAARQGKLMSLEAEVIAFFSEKSILNRPEAALARMQRVRKQKGENVLLDFLLASAHGELQQNEQSLHVLKNRSRYAGSPAVFFFPYWDHAMAKGLYFQGDYFGASQAFRRFLKAHKGSIYKLDASFRLGMAQCLSGQDEAAEKTFSSLEELESSAFDEDEYAMAMARRFAAQLPGENLKALFRARNFFDGGYLEKALKTLDELKKKSQGLQPEEITELHYRYGRIYHRQQQWGLASRSYRFCIAQPASDQKWMQAYASFYLGEIARQKGEKEVARRAYEQALRYEDFYYQGGLESRSKAALAALKKSK
jgi:tetratricopeptide (TPR) repeat protein